MTSMNADYDQLFPCTADGETLTHHHWTTVPDVEFGSITKCLQCHIVQLPTSVTGKDLLPNGPYMVPDAHARREEDGNIVSEPHVMTTIGDAFDAFRTAPGNRDGSYPTKRHFVQTLTASGMDHDAAARLYKRNRHSIVELHWTNSPEVAKLPLL